MGAHSGCCRPPPPPSRSSLSALAGATSLLTRTITTVDRRALADEDRSRRLEASVRVAEHGVVPDAAVDQIAMPLGRAGKAGEIGVPSDTVSYVAISVAPVGSGMRSACSASSET